MKPLLNHPNRLAARAAAPNRGSSPSTAYAKQPTAEGGRLICNEIGCAHGHDGEKGIEIDDIRVEAATTKP